MKPLLVSPGKVPAQLMSGSSGQFIFAPLHQPSVLFLKCPSEEAGLVHTIVCPFLFF